MENGKSVKGRPGPDPKRLTVDEKKWEDAVSAALKKKRPKGGWPKETGAKREDAK